MSFCCDILKGAWWFYADAKPDINFCPYCGRELDFIRMQRDGKKQTDWLSVSQTAKLKEFVNAFNELATSDTGEVEHGDLIEHCMWRKKFQDRDEVKQFIKIALNNGQIYERREGTYAKT